MDKSQRILLEKILKSPHFSSAENLQRILQFLCLKTAPPGAPAVKEHEIATQALDRPEAFDPRIDPIVRVNISSIRERLAKFFSNEGRREPLRLAVPKGEYKAIFYRSSSPSDVRRSEDVRWPALERFWQPYLIGSMENVLLFTELLFFRDGEGNFVRNIFVNDPREGDKYFAEGEREVTLHEVIPTYHFLSAGDMLCMCRIFDMFGQLGVKMDTQNTRLRRPHDLHESNAILIGASRTNPYFSPLKGEGNFLLEDDRIVNRNPRKEEQSEYRRECRKDGKLDRITEYALVVRKPLAPGGACLTAIASNHGRALEGVAKLLTQESATRLLLQQLRLDEEDGPMPLEFEILFRVEMIDFYEEVLRADYVSHRISKGPR